MVAKHFFGVGRSARRFRKTRPVVAYGRLQRVFAVATPNSTGAQISIPAGVLWEREKRCEHLHGGVGSLCVLAKKCSLGKREDYSVSASRSSAFHPTPHGNPTAPWSSSASALANMRAWCAFSRRVFQILLSEALTPERCLESYHLHRTRLELIAEQKVRRRLLTDDGNVEITGRDRREREVRGSDPRPIGYRCHRVSVRL
jgi:hypothetical protein